VHLFRYVVKYTVTDSLFNTQVSILISGYVRQTQQYLLQL